ncbi:Ribosomal protein L7Ae [Pelagirhabdus alkalitolerans]|uniref:Ribosomal protein L7Ae n=1 Tax=Pelagirhabdus alkalitolerans TaxID=1612202 RepID=A0A1G6H4F4_9BACI|nr:YlxQ family RNA-binding protein [Pelagirhabdus alkalitolerans]SDB89043.1 Ribosomal protein L7Ae [Pelagirhabdus alkalitolerans]
MSNEKAFLNLLGLATRARKISLGEEQILKDIKRKQAKLVLIASDTGYQTHKRLTDKCTFYNIPYRIVTDRLTLSAAIGKADRVAIAVNDEGFAKKMCTLLD